MAGFPKVQDSDNTRYTWNFIRLRRRPRTCPWPWPKAEAGASPWRNAKRLLRRDVTGLSSVVDSLADDLSEAKRESSLAKEDPLRNHGLQSARFHK